MSPDLQTHVPIAAVKYKAMRDAFRDAPQSDGRFSGTPEEQQALAGQLKALLDDPGGELLYIDRPELLGLAADLEAAQANWSIGQYSSALASLIDFDRSVPT